MWTVLFFFFFQAEDGIRDKLVTGVQTCALPILRSGGTILIIDIGVPKNLLAKIAGTVFSLVEAVGPNLHGFIPKVLKEVGFGNVQEVESKFGLFSFYRARK